MASASVDFLIVGQGLAGALLAFRLRALGCSVMAIDQRHENTASTVAAGIINPITGHRWNLTHNFEVYLPPALALYRQIESELGVPIITPIRQTRLVKNAGQANTLDIRLRDPRYARLLKKTQTEDFIDQGFACAHINQSYRVDTVRLLDAVRQSLQSSGAVLDQHFDYQALRQENSSLRYQHLRINQLVFCEGIGASTNPWLKHLPFKPASGSVLEVQTNKPINAMLNWGVWLLPISGQRAKLGSTYHWHTPDQIDLHADQQRLVDSAHKFTKLSLEPNRLATGVRPSTIDRTPFVGALTNLENAYCLNGLGSKGCLIAPHLIEQLINLMRHNTPLDKAFSRWL